METETFTGDEVIKNRGYSLEEIHKKHLQILNIINQLELDIIIVLLMSSIRGIVETTPIEDSKSFLKSITLNLMTITTDLAKREKESE